MRRMLEPVPGLLAACLLAGCLPDNPGTEQGEEETGDGGEVVEGGLLGCPGGESCTIVALSQTIDDRVELYTAAGPGPSYRGALDLDLKPNPGGDISGELLDEPYGLTWDGEALHVLVGHYPTREFGSLLSFPASSLAEAEAGAQVPASEWFLGDQQTTGGVSLLPLGVTEPLSMILHPSSGALLIAVFANDLTVPDDQWTAASELLALQPGEDAPASADVGCAGAWSIVALDEAADTVALACDGDELIAIMDASPVAGGDPPTLVCTAVVPYAGRRVRYLAPDGMGGVLAAETPPIASGTEDARMWWFRGDCSLRGFTTLESPTSWAVRELIALPDTPAPRWLISRTDGDERGVIVLAGEAETGTVSECGRVGALDEAGAWTASGGSEPLRPHALDLSADGRGLAVGLGPANYDNVGPGYGSLWWVELDYGDEPCDAGGSATELSASAPAVDPNVPQTWRRAPDVVHVIEVSP